MVTPASRTKPVSYYPTPTEIFDSGSEDDYLPDSPKPNQGHKQQAQPAVTKAVRAPKPWKYRQLKHDSSYPNFRKDPLWMELLDEVDHKIATSSIMATVKQAEGERKALLDVSQIWGKIRSDQTGAEGQDGPCPVCVSHGSSCVVRLALNPANGKSEIVSKCIRCSVKHSTCSIGIKSPKTKAGSGDLEKESPAVSSSKRAMRTLSPSDSEDQPIFSKSHKTPRLSHTSTREISPLDVEPVAEAGPACSSSSDMPASEEDQMQGPLDKVAELVEEMKGMLASMGKLSGGTSDMFEAVEMEIAVLRLAPVGQATKAQGTEAVISLKEFAQEMQEELQVDGSLGYKRKIMVKTIVKQADLLDAIVSKL